MQKARRRAQVTSIVLVNIVVIIILIPINIVIIIIVIISRIVIIPKRHVHNAGRFIWQWALLSCKQQIEHHLHSE